jgi:hypothetical protein
MSVLLYLLPLGPLFDLAGYLPPALRLGLLYGLLALPLCLKPSRQAAWLAGLLGLAAVVRVLLPMPAVAETAVFLLVHLAVWSVMAPVPRALRIGVAAYAFIHLYLMNSPLGHPLLETLAAAGNRISQMMAGQTLNLGPSYQNLGSLLLFTVLSLFAWDRSRVAFARTAGFLLVALLLNALGGALLIGQADFAASFSWSLKFRDAFGFPELWKQLKGLAVIMFPAFLFAGHLAAFVFLHFGRTPHNAGEVAAPGWPGLREELQLGRQRIVLFVLAAMLVAVAVPPTAWRHPARCDLVFVERGVVSFTKPDYTRFGESAGGMFGMLPEYARLFGAKTTVVKDIPAAFDPGQVLVLTNLDQDIGAEARARVWEHVAQGGRLWVLGDHTFIKNGRNHLNELLAPSHISFNNDSAQFFPQGWFHSYRFPQGTPFASLRDDGENRPGILVGASLELGVPAQPLVFGRFGYSDWGLDKEQGDRGYLGDFKYQASERLGDLVLVAGELHGKGRVLVFGDTSSFFNNNLTRSFEILRASLGWLGESNGWSFHATGIGRALAASLLAVYLGMAFAWRAQPVAAAPLCAMALTSLAIHGNGGLPDYDETFAREHLAVIDFSHHPNASKHSAMDGGLHGLGINLLRHGKLPVVLNEWNPEVLEKARYVVLNAPRQPVTGSARRELMGFMQRGGWVILGCGYLDAAGSKDLLEPLGCRIGATPLGRFFDLTAFGQRVSFMSAWGIEKIPANAEVLCGSADWPLMVSMPVGKGGLILVSDSEFLQNRNLEGHKNHDPANTTFLKNLLDSLER